MAFDDLTENPKQLVINLVENIATGSFESEFYAIGTLGGWSLDLYGKDGAESVTLNDFAKTDLIALAEEGYITLIASDKYSYTASLKPKAYDQYKLFKTPADSAVVVGSENYYDFKFVWRQSVNENNRIVKGFSRRTSKEL